MTNFKNIIGKYSNNGESLKKTETTFIDVIFDNQRLTTILLLYY